MPGHALLLAPAPGIPVLGPSGASAHLRGVAGAFLDLGYTLSVVAAKASDRRGVHGSLRTKVQVAGAPGWPSWLPKYRERREVWAANKVARLALRGPKPELIYERWSLFSLAGERVRARTGAPWILEVNAPLLEERLRFEELRDPPFAERMQRRALLSADRLVVVSPWLAGWLCEKIGVRPERVVVVPNGTSAHRVDAEERRQTREQLGLTGHFVVGFLGTLKPWHGAQRLPEIVAQIPGARGLIVGDGPTQVQGVRSTGQLDEAASARAVAAMDVGLIPYPADAPPWFCPLKLWAYRAQGTPVVATELGAMREWVGEGGSVVGQGGLVEGVLAWRGRRAPVHLRSWTTVLREALAGLG